MDLDPSLRLELLVTTVLRVDIEGLLKPDTDFRREKAVSNGSRRLKIDRRCDRETNTGISTVERRGEGEADEVGVGRRDNGGVEMTGRWASEDLERLSCGRKDMADSSGEGGDYCGRWGRKEAMSNQTCAA